MSTATTTTTNQIKEILQYLEPYLSFVNCHMVDYFTKSLFDLHVSDEIKQELNRTDHRDVIDGIFKRDCATNLSDFIRKTTSFSLYNLPLCLTISQLQDKLGCEDLTSLKLDVFMNSKKSHEVEVLSAITASLKTIANTTHVIDIGDGRGYLSSMLALHHKIPVLGVDASLTKTTSAVKRVEKLQRVWNGIVTKKAMHKCISSTYGSDSSLYYKPVTQHVSESTDFKQLVANVFLEHDSRLSLVGLHTCGNLAPSSIKIYSENADVKTICNVGCCYHLLTEVDEVTKRNPGFPMSEFLIGKGVKLGRNARMLAAQSIDRILHNKQLPNKNIFYRAVFEVVLHEYCQEEIPNRHVGKLHQTSRCFVEYAHRAMAKLQTRLVVSDEELMRLHDVYANREYELYIFNLMRCMFAPVIETLILLDRLLYLQEQGFKNTFLVQLFDPVISPRCYGLIGYKNGAVVDCLNK